MSCLRAEADLRIGELQWGDSGVYFCKVVIADDLEGVNEGQLELLVLGTLITLNEISVPDGQWLALFPSLFVCLFACGALWSFVCRFVKVLV